MSANTIRERPPISADHGQLKIRDTDRVWLEYVESENKFYVWHWCTNVGHGGVEPRWVKMGVAKHLVWVGPDGASLDPSLFFNECCGLHGWVKLGRWLPA